MRLYIKLFLGCMLWLSAINISARTHAVAKVEKKPILVTTIAIEKIAFYPVEDVPATVISLHDSTLSTELQGQILDLPFEVGDIVKKGQVIAKLDCVDYQLNAERIVSEKQAIQIDIEFNEWQLNKIQTLATSQNASEENVRKYESTLKKLKANLQTNEAILKNARYNISRCKVLAPFDGVIVQRFASIGDFATVGTKILKIVDTSHNELEALLHVSEVARLKNAQILNFKYNDKNYSVKIRSIIPMQDPKTRTQIVRLQFDDQSPDPGAAGRLTWSSSQLALPAEYLQRQDQKLGIFLAQDDHAKFMYLPDAIEGQPVIFTELPKYPIIVDGRFVIQDGSKIVVNNE